VRAAARALAIASTFATAGCGDEAKSFAPADVRASTNPAVATLVDVQWTTPAPAIGYVGYGTTPSLGSVSAIEPTSTTQHKVSLFGLTPGTTYYYQVVVWQGHDAGESSVQTVTAGAVPASLPTFTTTGDVSENGMDELVLLPVTTSKPVVVVLSPKGQVLWYHEEDRPRTVTRARFSTDKTSVLYDAIDAGGDSEIVRVALDGSSQTAVPVKGLGNDFVQLTNGNGNFAALVADTRDSNGTMLRGDKIVEVTPSGTPTDIASIWSCFDPATAPGDGPAGEWTGASALVVDEGSSKMDESDDVFYVALRDLSTIVRIPRATGKCDSVIGKTMPTVTFADPADPFAHPGGFNVASTDLIVLDADGVNGSSRAIEYTLDLTANTATKSWSYTPTPAVHVTSLGHVSQLTQGRRLVNWSSAGRVDLAGKNGAQVWSLTGPAGATFGHHVRTDSLDDPSSKP
jgi:hypothetical protein